MNRRPELICKTADCLWSKAQHAPASSSALQLPLLRLRAVAYRHGDVTLRSDRLGDSETLADGYLVDPVRLLQETQRTGHASLHDDPAELIKATFEL